MIKQDLQELEGIGCKVRTKDKEVVFGLKAKIQFKVESSSIRMELPKKQQHYPVVVTVLKKCTSGQQRDHKTVTICQSFYFLHYTAAWESTAQVD